MWGYHIPSCSSAAENKLYESVTFFESHIYRKHASRAVIRSLNSREVFFV